MVSIFWFREVATNVSELLRSFKKTPFPRAALLIRCRWINEFIDLLGC